MSGLEIAVGLLIVFDFVLILVVIVFTKRLLGIEEMFISAYEDEVDRYTNTMDMIVELREDLTRLAEATLKTEKLK